MWNGNDNFQSGANITKNISYSCGNVEYQFSLDYLDPGLEALEAAFKPPEEQSEVITYDQTNSTNIDASEFDQNLREASKKFKNSDIGTSG